MQRCCDIAPPFLFFQQVEFVNRQEPLNRFQAQLKKASLPSDGSLYIGVKSNLLNPQLEFQQGILSRGLKVRKGQ